MNNLTSVGINLSIAREKCLIVLITGAPRERKTTRAIKEALKFDLPILVVARTVKNCDATSKTMLKYIPEVKKRTIVQLAGKDEICSRFSEEVNQTRLTGSLHHDLVEFLTCEQCDAKKSTKRMSKRVRSYFNEVILGRRWCMSAENLREMSSQETDFCPSLTMWEFLHHKVLPNNGIVVLTYAMYKNVIDDFEGEFVTIFDEARYLEGYDFDKLPFELNTPFASRMSYEKIIEEYERKVYASIATVEHHELTSEIVKFFAYVRNPEIKPNFSIPTRDKLVALVDRFRLVEEAYDILVFCQSLMSCNRRLYIENGDDMDGRHSVTAISCPMSDDGTEEKRELFEKAVSRSSRIYLVDSTPFPTFRTGLKGKGNWIRMWLGNDYDIDVEDLGCSYDFTVVYEDAHRNLRDSLGNQVNQERFMSLLRGIEGRILRNDGLKPQIFGRCKKECQVIEKETGLAMCVSRGTEVEGVKSKSGADYTINTGPPWPNINADRWRVPALSRMTGYGEGVVLKSYHQIKMLQALVQQSFRTARHDGSSWSIWLGITEREVSTAESCFPWLKKVNIIDAGCKSLDVASKVAMFEEALITGKPPAFTPTQALMSDKIVDLCKECKEGASTSYLLRSIGGNYSDFRYALWSLEEEGKIIPKKIYNGKKGRPTVNYFSI